MFARYVNKLQDCYNANCDFLVGDLDGLAALLREDLRELVDILEGVGACAQLEPAGRTLLLVVLIKIKKLKIAIF